MALGQNILNLRKRHGFSQEELGDKVSVTRQTISNWELEETAPNPEQLKLLSKALCVSIDELVENNDYIKEDRKEFYISYEYKSKKNIKGIPLIHINIGYKAKARGIIAIGNNAKGVIALGGKSVGLFSIGGFSLGIISIGGIGLGLFSIAGIALALLMSIGAVSIAPFAIGGIAIGILSLGGLSFGYYSIGGYSIGKYFSIGGYANGHIAIGHHVNGDITPINLTSSEVKKLILNNYPNTWKFIIDFICSFFKG